MHTVVLSFRKRGFSLLRAVPHGFFPQLFLVFTHFLLVFPSPAASICSLAHILLLQMAFAPDQSFDSSRSSLRKSWVRQSKKRGYSMGISPNRFCSQCGTQLAPNAQFCMNCRSSVSE